MNPKQPNLRGRYLTALDELHRLAPDIYTEKHVAAQRHALPKLTDAQLLYFVLSAERSVRWKKARLP